MNTTPLEDEVHDALHRRVDPLQRSPLDLTDVRRRARRIRRGRRVAAGAAVAAALAVAVPVGLSMNGPVPRTDVPPATQTPEATGPVLIDPRSADIGHAPRVPLIVSGEHSRVLLGGEEYAMPGGWDQITPYGDGWLATGPSDDQGNRALEVLTDDFGVEDGPVDSSWFAVSADGTRVAWPEHDGAGSWRIVNSDIGRQAEPADVAVPGTREEAVRVVAVPGTREEAVRVVGFLSSDEIVFAQTDASGGSETPYVATGEFTTELPGLIHAVSASPATGMVAGLTEVDGAESCSAVVDGRTRTGDPMWTTCEHQLGAFSPDGERLVGFADIPDGPSPTLSILDATTGDPILDFEVTGARDRVVGIVEAVWETDETLLATYVDGTQQYVVRLGLDGTVERIAGPVTNDDFGLSLHLTPRL